MLVFLLMSCSKMAPPTNETPPIAEVANAKPEPSTIPEVGGQGGVIAEVRDTGPAPVVELHPPPSISRWVSLSLRESKLVVREKMPLSRHRLNMVSGIRPQVKGDELILAFRDPVTSAKFIESTLSSLVHDGEKTRLARLQLDGSKPLMLVELTMERSANKAYLYFGENEFVAVVNGGELVAFPEDFAEHPKMKKPILYLYPEREQLVRVQVSPPDPFWLAYPPLDQGAWTVRARKDGLLTDLSGREHRFLFWEAPGDPFIETNGYSVKASESIHFLQKVCQGFQLTDVECGDFLTYWLPTFQEAPYTTVFFPDDEYSQRVPLTVSPAPDTVIRLFMVLTPSQQKVAIAPYEFPHPTREGFVVVEWGGMVQD